MRCLDGLRFLVVLCGNGGFVFTLYASDLYFGFVFCCGIWFLGWSWV